MKEQKNKRLDQVLFYVVSKIGVSIHWSFIYNVLLPNDIVTIIGPDYKESALGVILCLMNVMQVIAGVFTAVASDYVDVKLSLFPRDIFNKKTLRKILPKSLVNKPAGEKLINILNYLSRRFVAGKRKPYILFGIFSMLFMFVGRLAFVFPVGQPNIIGWALLVGYSVVTIIAEGLFSVQDICYYAMIPENFSEKQVGLVSGLVSFCDLFGVAIGVGAFGAVFRYIPEFVSVFAISIMIIVLSALLVFVREVKPKFVEAKVHGPSILKRVLNKVLKRKPKKAAEEKITPDLTGSGQQPNSTVGSVEYENKESEENKESNESTPEPISSKPEQKEEAIDDKSEIEGVHDEDEDEEEDEDEWDETTIHSIIRLAKTLTPKTLFKFAIHLLLDVLSRFKSKNFDFIFVVIFLLGFGISTVENYFLYFLTDVIGEDNFIIDLYWWRYKLTDNAQVAQSILMACMLCFCLISAVLGGIISDKIGCKIIITLDGFLFAAVTIGMVAFANFTMQLPLVACFGICIGTYMSSALALVSKVLPSSDNTAVGFGIMAFAMESPIITSVPIVGFILQIGKFLNERAIVNFPRIGYVMAFSLCAVFQILGGIITLLFINEKQILKEQKINREKEEKKKAEKLATMKALKKAKKAVPKDKTKYNDLPDESKENQEVLA